MKETISTIREKGNNDPQRGYIIFNVDYNSRPVDKNSFYNLTKGTLSVDEYIWKFKAICHKQAAIGKPLSNVNKVFQVSKGLENKYKEFEILVLFKYSSNLLCLSKF